MTCTFREITYYVSYAVRGGLLCLLLTLLGGNMLMAQEYDNFFDDELPDAGKTGIEETKKPEPEKKKEPEPEKVNIDDPVGPRPAAKVTPKGDEPVEQVAPLVERPRESLLDNSRFSLASGYFQNMGPISETLPSGIEFASFGWEADEADGWGFDMRLEGGYFQTQKGDNAVTGFYGALGPVWIIPYGQIFKGSKLPMNFFFGFIPGVGQYRLKNAVEEITALKFTGYVAVGTEYFLSQKRSRRTDEIFFFLQARYGYIYDNVAPLMSYGAYAGVGYKFGKVQLAKY